MCFIERAEKRRKYEKISEPIDKYFYSTVIVMMMLKIAIECDDEQKKGKNGKRRETISLSAT